MSGLHLSESPQDDANDGRQANEADDRMHHGAPGGWPMMAASEAMPRAIAIIADPSSIF